MNDVLQVVMERSFWMYNLSRLDPSYITEVQKFIDAAQNYASRTRKTHIHCQCMDCRNLVVSDDIQQILTHFGCSYTVVLLLQRDLTEGD